MFRVFLSLVLQGEQVICYAVTLLTDGVGKARFLQVAAELVLQDAVRWDQLGPAFVVDSGVALFVQHLLGLPFPGVVDLLNNFLDRSNQRLVPVPF